MYHTRRQNQPYYLVPVKRKQGKSVFYYRLYDPDSRQQIGQWSTGLSIKRDAVLFCEKLMEEDRLIPDKFRTRSKANPPLFKDYFSQWFDWPDDQEPNCPYIQKRLKRGKSYSRKNAKTQRGSLSRYIFPAFGDFPKHKITSEHLESWLYNLPDEMGIKNVTANNLMRTVKVMFAECYRLGHIPKNPAESVQFLGQKPEPKGIPIWSEIHALFNYDQRNLVWASQLARIGAMTAAATGLRAGEIRALRGQDIHESYISVNHTVVQLSKNQLKIPKNNKTRVVPITSYHFRSLQELRKGPDDFLFSLDGGKSPVGENYFRDNFIKSLEVIGIKREVQKSRGIRFHSLRRFFNSMLQLHGIQPVKIREIIGHGDEDMTALYTLIPLDEYRQEKVRTIPEIQDRILSGDTNG